MDNFSRIQKLIDIDHETILDVNVHLIDKVTILKKIEQRITTPNEEILFVNYVNAHGLLLAQKSNVFKNVLNSSSILFCDGFGVSLAAKIQGKRMGERMTPPDWFDDLIQIIIFHKKNIFFVGDTESVVKRFYGFVQEKHPELRVSGYCHGFVNKVGQENENLINTINSSSTDILITGMGMPIQEIWAFDNMNKLNVEIVLSTGALFRHLIGEDKRGPKFFTDKGLEWFFRLLYNPAKFWKRYLVGIPQLLLLVLKEKYLARQK